jgi:hypothetical protein
LNAKANWLCNRSNRLPDAGLDGASETGFLTISILTEGLREPASERREPRF